MSGIGERSKPIRLVIADDHAVVRPALRLMLEMDDDMSVVGEGVDGAEAVSLT